MRSQIITFTLLTILFLACSTHPDPSPELFENPTLPATWTPTRYSTPGLFQPAGPETETQMATMAFAEEATSISPSLTPAPGSSQSSSPIFTGGEQWLVTIPGVSYPYLSSTRDGGFLLLGLRAKREEQRHNVLFKFGSRGELLWERILLPGHFYGVLEVRDGGLLLVDTQSLTKLDSDGQIEWQEYLSYDQDGSPFISSYYDFQSSQAMGDGQTILFDAGSITSFDFYGSFINQRAILGAARDSRSSIWYTTQAKWTAGIEGNTGFWVKREGAYTSSWLRTFDFQNLGITINFPETVVLGTRDGGALFVASVQHLIRPAFAIWVVRLDPAGEILWQTAFDGVDVSNLRVQEAADGGFIIASRAGHRGDDLSGTYLRILRTDAAGGLLWDHFVGDGKWRVHPKAILNMPNRGVLIVGEVVVSGDQVVSEVGDVFLLKVDQDGIVSGCPWLQSAPYGEPVERSPLSSMSSEPNIPFSKAVINSHSYVPQSLEIMDGFDQFSTICVFPPIQEPTPKPYPTTSFPSTPVDASRDDNEASAVIALADGTILGSIRTGKWISSTQSFDRYGDLLSFQLYDTNGLQGEVQGVIRRAEAKSACPESPTVAFTYPLSGLEAIVLSADWDAQPRGVQPISSTISTYQEILRQYLSDSGINNPEIQINSISKADLEGDGFEEVILSGSWYQDGASNRGVSIDDYNVVLLRKIINGEVVTHSLHKEIYKAENGAIIPVSNIIAGILDLNGDGVMEIIMKGISGAGTDYFVIDTTQSLEDPALQISCKIR